MLSETTKPSHGHSQAPTEEEKHKNYKELDREIRNMVNAITGRVTDHHHKPGSSSLLHHEEDDHEDGVRIVTLAGSNTGATMRTELTSDDKLNPHGHGETEPQHEPLSSYVNSNFQAVNNSIMLSSSYSTNDPGVHLDITDVYAHKPADKHGKKAKKKDKETFKSDHHTDQHSDWPHPLTPTICKSTYTHTDIEQVRVLNNYRLNS